MEELYRIISFPAFVNLTERKEERYVSPATWEDTYECYLMRMIEQKEKTRYIIEKFYKDLSPKNASAVIDNYMKLLAARWLCVGQCWSKIPESDALWRIYSYNKMSVRIRSNAENIKALINSENSHQYNVVIDDVKYDLEAEDIIDKQLNIIKDTQRIVEPFFHKRKAFEHECEKRIIITDNYDIRIYGSTPACLAFSNFKYFFREKGYTDLPPEKEILDLLEQCIAEIRQIFDSHSLKSCRMFSIPDLPSYVDGVMVHPQAEDWIVSLVESICERTGLNFEGKSKMYSALS